MVLEVKVKWATDRLGWVMFLNRSSDGWWYLPIQVDGPFEW